MILKKIEVPTYPLNNDNGFGTEGCRKGGEKGGGDTERQRNKEREILRV